MRNLRLPFLLVAAALLPAVTLAQNTPIAPPSQDSLDGISHRGRMLARYHFAAMMASRAFEPVETSTDQVQLIMVRVDQPRLEVAFGRISDDSSAFLVAYWARQESKPDSFTISRADPVVRDTGYYARATRALVLANSDWGPQRRPYLSAPIPTGDGEWWVYAFPAPRPPVFPVGGDVRYRVSGDGRTILARRLLHNTVREYRPDPARGSPAAEIATAVLDNVPEDTDVYHVLVRQPMVNQYIVTEGYVFRIETNGRITNMGLREALSKP